MGCEYLPRLATPEGIVRVSLAAEAVFASTNRPCVGTNVAMVPRCFEPQCPCPLSGGIYMCVECVFGACNADVRAYTDARSSQGASGMVQRAADTSCPNGSSTMDGVEVVEPPMEASMGASSENPEHGEEAMNETAKPGRDATMTSPTCENSGSDKPLGGMPQAEPPNDGVSPSQETEIICKASNANVVTADASSRSARKCVTHVRKHDLDAMHPISLSVEHGRLYCVRCDDFVYNSYLDAAIELQRRIAISHRRNFLSSVSPLDAYGSSPATRNVLSRAKSEAESVGVSVTDGLRLKRSRDPQAIPSADGGEPSASQQPGTTRGALAITSTTAETVTHPLVRDRAKRRRVATLNHWTPSPRELAIIDQHAVGGCSSLFAERPPMVHPPMGLYNMGNSCYMNAVLQAFLHAPPLRGFFLADCHRPNCTAKSRESCLACALDSMVCDSYLAETSDKGRALAEKMEQDPSTTGFFMVPQRVMEIMWKDAPHLATYMQQDAHEFCIAMLNCLNKHCKSRSHGRKRCTPEDEARAEVDGSLADQNAKDSVGDNGKRGHTSPSKKTKGESRGPGSRTVASPSTSGSTGVARENKDGTTGETDPAFEHGIIQNLFSGTLQSDVICCKCGNSSPTLEKFYDISLDVDNVAKPCLASRRSRQSSPDVGSGTPGSGARHGGSTPAAGSSRAASVERVADGGRSSSAEQTLQAAAAAAAAAVSVAERKESPCPSPGKGSGGGGQRSPSPARSGEEANHVGAGGDGDDGGSGRGDVGDKDAEATETTNTLAECLARFTEPEMLGESAKMYCQACGCKQEAMKQLSVRSLPPILCLHFKRFEQSFGRVRRSETIKVDTPVEFPVDSLDMRAYQTSSVLRKRLDRDVSSESTNVDATASSGVSGPGSPLEADGAPSGMPFATGGGSLDKALKRLEGEAVYDLFAVVNHKGKIDRGHYTTLIRRRGRWFRCDDETVTHEPDVGAHVCSGEAYLAFYVQRKPNFTF